MQRSFIATDFWRSEIEHVASRRMLSNYHPIFVEHKQTHTSLKIYKGCIAG